MPLYIIVPNTIPDTNPTLAAVRSKLLPLLYPTHSTLTPTPYFVQALYPSFRVIKFKRNKHGQAMINVTVLEPAFYWRIQRDYDDAPPPTVVLFDPKTDTLETIRNKIMTTRNHHHHPMSTRIVLQVCHVILSSLPPSPFHLVHSLQYALLTYFKPFLTLSYPHLSIN